MKQSFKIKKYNWSIVIYYTVNDEEMVVSDDE